MQITISDIKQFIYCPRKIYYTYVEPVPWKKTFKMKYGKEQHNELIKKEKRRNLKIYGLKEGKRYFGYTVHSEKYNLSGRLDILVECENDEAGQRYFPVECKDTDYQIHNSTKYQLIAYALVLEEQLGSLVNEGYIYIIPKNKVYTIYITDEERTYVRKVIHSIRNIIKNEHYPNPRSKKRCLACEYIRYCNDYDIPFEGEQLEKNIALVKKLFKNN